MTAPLFDRRRLVLRPLRERHNRVHIDRDQVSPDTALPVLAPAQRIIVDRTLARIRQARAQDRPVMLTFGAHTIKNGLAPVLIKLIENRWITHLATNGAGVIHDWEFAFQGQSSEDVRANLHNGQFGLWQETGFYINLAIVLGALHGRGYGESIGEMIEQESLNIPSSDLLKAMIHDAVDTNPEQAAAAADCLDVAQRLNLTSGRRDVPHPFKRFSIQAAAYRLGVPFTGHPMIGHDIIYCHPMNHGGAIGRVALRDFLTFAESVNRLDGGVYLSLGSAVMSPMIFEKSMSMSQNLHLQNGRRIENHYILVVDLAESSWDWQSQGEPTPDNPAYYVRSCKTFSRMGGEFRYLAMDNRDFLLSLWQGLSA